MNTFTTHGSGQAATVHPVWDVFWDMVFEMDAERRARQEAAETDPAADA